jgi:uncharacterized protein (TIGR02996 family)
VSTPEAAFLEAILDEPDEDGPRLVFADWLEENGQTDRAAWIRASCELARVGSDDPRWQSLVLQVPELFSRCKPDWWAEPEGVTARNDGGILYLTVGSRTAVRRLGKVPWLARAQAEGWLAGVSITWSDEQLALTVATWEGDLRAVPLHVRLAPQISDVGLGIYLDWPRLTGLDAPAHALRNPAVGRLGHCAALRQLTLEFRLLSSERVDGLMDQVVRLTGLRRLGLKGHHLREYGDRPNDGDLQRLGGLAGLRRLRLDDCSAVTEAGLATLRQALPGLVIERGVVMRPWW